MNSPPSPEPELLTVKQFAQRLQVSRATVFTWLHNKVLSPGTHYLKIGRVLRFIWSGALLASINQGVACAAPCPVPIPKARKRTPINWDY